MTKPLSEQKKIKSLLHQFVAALGRQAGSMHQSYFTDRSKMPNPNLLYPGVKKSLSTIMSHWRHATIGILLRNSGNQNNTILKIRYRNSLKATTKTKQQQQKRAEQIKSLVSILFPNLHTVEWAPHPMSIFLLIKGVWRINSTIFT